MLLLHFWVNYLFIYWDQKKKLWSKVDGRGKVGIIQTTTKAKGLSESRHWPPPIQSCPVQYTPISSLVTLKTILPSDWKKSPPFGLHRPGLSSFFLSHGSPSLPCTCEVLSFPFLPFPILLCCWWASIFVFWCEDVTFVGDRPADLCSVCW